MFDVVEAFKKQFTRVEGGYLIYPSKKSGGKLVSDDEYEHMVAQWEKIAGRTGKWKAAGAVIAVIVVWGLLPNQLSAPWWASPLIIIGLTVCGWFMWGITAPLRLVRHRAPVSPPRPRVEAQRQHRAGLSWPFVLLTVLASGAVFVSSVTTAERTAYTWALLIGSGAMLGVNFWIGFNKLLDGKR